MTTVLGLEMKSRTLAGLASSLEALIAEYETNRLALINATERIAVLEAAKQCPDCGKMEAQRDMLADELVLAEKLMREVGERPNVPNREGVRIAAANVRAILETLGR